MFFYLRIFPFEVYLILCRSEYIPIIIYCLTTIFFFVALLNGTWYPLRERYPNGDAKCHQPIVADQDDDIESSPSQSPNGKGK